MGFGQYHEATTNLNERREAAGLPVEQRDSGFPVPREDVKTGRMTNAEIMADVDADPVSVKRTGHNEVTRVLKSGTIICRLRETDIVHLFRDGCIEIDTGGWNTPTTRRHIMDFLSRHNFSCSIYGDKKRGGNVLTGIKTGDASEIIFKQMVTIFTDGTWTADWTGG